MIIDWQIRNLESLLFTKEVMDENFKAYGQAYKNTLEYEWFSKDLWIMNLKNEIYETILKLWN